MPVKYEPQVVQYAGDTYYVVTPLPPGNGKAKSGNAGNASSVRNSKGENTQRRGKGSPGSDSKVKT
ncbi:MAG: hypothetical protein Q7T82_02740 [Armatimonadota bacterium]|nr:hypothetical protein [Armatimonadota bacterium]